MIIDVSTKFGQGISVELVEGADAVNNMLRNLFETPYGSERFQPTLGVNTEFYLQEPIGEDVARDIYFDLKEAIKKEIPQMEIIAPSSITPNFEYPGYDVSLYWVFASSNLSGILQFGLQRDSQ
jgi:phage baseplate assembly protein W